MSARAEYTNKKGAEKSFQCSSAAARERTSHDQERNDLKKLGRRDYLPLLDALYTALERISGEPRWPNPATGWPRLSECHTRPFMTRSKVLTAPGSRPGSHHRGVPRHRLPSYLPPSQVTI